MDGFGGNSWSVRLRWGLRWLGLVVVHVQKKEKKKLVNQKNKKKKNQSPTNIQQKKDDVPHIEKKKTCLEKGTLKG